MPRKKPPLNVSFTITNPHYQQQGDWRIMNGQDSKTGKLVIVIEYRPKGDEE